MKVLTLTQPWATLISIGAKKIETRSWPTAYRGPLAIHAAKGYPKWAKEMCATEPFRSVLFDYMHDLIHSTNAGVLELANAIPLGAIVCTCRLVGTFRTEVVTQSTLLADPLTVQERAFGDYSPGRWAWNLADIQPLATPIPAKGALGLWEFDMNEVQV